MSEDRRHLINHHLLFLTLCSGWRGRAMRSEDKEYRGGWRQAQHSHVNFDLVLLAQVWPQKQVLDSSMLHLKASALWGRERIITLALNFFFPFFFCLHLSTSNCIYLFGSHSFIHSLTHILSYFRKYFVQGAQLSSNVTLTSRTLKECKLMGRTWGS